MLAGTGVWKISSVACGFSSFKIDYSDYPKSLISRINEVYFFFNKISLERYLIDPPPPTHTHKPHLSRLFCCNHTCYCVNMVSVTSASRSIMSASRYHPRYQSSSSMYIRRGLIPRNFAELAEAHPIAFKWWPEAVCWLGSILWGQTYVERKKRAVACDFQQCGFLTCVDSDEPLQPAFKLRNSKLCSFNSLTIIEYSSDWQRL